MARARSDRRKQVASATGVGSAGFHGRGEPAAQASSSASNPGMPPAARVWIGPAATRLTRIPVGPRSRAR